MKVSSVSSVPNIKITGPFTARYFGDLFKLFYIFSCNCHWMGPTVSDGALTDDAASASSTAVSVASSIF